MICAASPVNESYVRSLGAEIVLDRWTSPADLIDAIRKATDDNVGFCAMEHPADINRLR